MFGVCAAVSLARENFQINWIVGKMLLEGLLLYLFWFNLKFRCRMEEIQMNSQLPTNLDSQLPVQISSDKFLYSYKSINLKNILNFEIDITYTYD